MVVIFININSSAAIYLLAAPGINEMIKEYILLLYVNKVSHPHPKLGVSVSMWGKVSLELAG